VNIHNSPWVVPEEVRAHIAHELVELSISSHQGGRGFWELLLGNSSLFPRLAYLRIKSVTGYYYLDDCGRAVPAPSNADYEASPDDWSVAERAESVDRSGLESIIVYASEDGVTVYPGKGAESVVLTFRDLSRGSWWFKLGVEWDRHVRILSDDVDTSFTSEFYDYILSGEVQPPCFLSIPAPRSSLSIKLQNVLFAIENLGTDVHCDGDREDDSGSIAFIPNYFIDHSERANVR